jgi:DNA polymerase-3 subunit beta
MKLTCSQAELNQALALVSRAISSRPSHPILSTVLLSADATTGQLTLTGYDLALGLQSTIPASVETSGVTALPAHLLGGIVARLANDSPITLHAAGEQATITSLSGSYQLSAADPTDYPDLPAAAGGFLSVDADALARAIRATAFCASSEESKKILMGVYLLLDDAGLECAATDGHRLAVFIVDDDSDAGATASTGQPGITIHARSIRELERLISSNPGAPVTLCHHRGQLVATCGDQRLISRTLDGTYPNYRQLIPHSFSRDLKLDRRGFSQALERVAVLADQENNVVKLRSDPEAGTVTILADAKDVGRGSESLPVVAEGEPIEIAFNVRYLLDGLKAMTSDQVLLRCNAPTTPAVLEPVGVAVFTYLVMPIVARDILKASQVRA